MNYASNMDPDFEPHFDNEPDESVVATRVVVIASILTVITIIAIIILTA